MNPIHVLYTSTTCTRCPLALKKLEESGVPHRVVVLDAPSNELELRLFREEAAERKIRMEMPILRTPDNQLLTNLATISDHFREMGAN